MEVRGAIQYKIMYRWLHSGYIDRKAKKLATLKIASFSMYMRAVMVGTERFELSTYGLRVRCSTN